MAHESTHGCTRKQRSENTVKPEGRGAVHFYDGTRLLHGAGLLLTLLVGCGPLGAGREPAPGAEGAAGVESVKKASTLNNGFQENLVLSGRTKPVALRFAPNGMAFLAEKSGLVFQFDDLLTGRISPHQVID